jgi:hypothetical protein
MENERIDGRWTQLQAFARRRAVSLKAAPSRGADHREIVEMLAAILWHLECCASLPALPATSMLKYRKDAIRSTHSVPWTHWTRIRRAMSSHQAGTQLRLTYDFVETPSSFAQYAVQATLVGDAVMRLGGLLGMLNEHHQDQSSPIQASPGMVATNIKQPEFERVAVILAYRDAYMHGEVPSDSDRRFATLRRRVERDYSLHDLFLICLAVWDDIFRFYAALRKR